MRKVLFLIVIFFGFNQQGFADTCTCFYGSALHPSSDKSCVDSIAACNSWCQDTHNPAKILGGAWISNASGQCALSHGCKFDAGKSIHDLNFTGGNKYEFCLSKGYNRFQPEGNYCWNAEC